MTITSQYFGSDKTEAISQAINTIGDLAEIRKRAYDLTRNEDIGFVYDLRTGVTTAFEVSIGPDRNGYDLVKSLKLVAELPDDQTVYLGSTRSNMIELTEDRLPLQLAKHNVPFDAALAISKAFGKIHGYLSDIPNHEEDYNIVVGRAKDRLATQDYMEETRKRLQRPPPPLQGTGSISVFAAEG